MMLMDDNFMSALLSPLFVHVPCQIAKVNEIAWSYIAERARNHFDLLARSMVNVASCALVVLSNLTQRQELEWRWTKWRIIIYFNEKLLF